MSAQYISQKLSADLDLKRRPSLSSRRKHISKVRRVLLRVKGSMRTKAYRDAKGEETSLKFQSLLHTEP